MEEAGHGQRTMLSWRTQSRAGDGVCRVEEATLECLGERRRLHEDETVHGLTRGALL